MTLKDLVKKLQAEMNAQGESLSLDGDPGPKTQSALAKFDVALVLSKRPVEKPVLDGVFEQPIDWARGELGQKEILGSKDNPRIRWYHTHCANIGSKEHPDEVAWCSSFLNAAADECGMKKTDNALANSWDRYGEDSGDMVEEGDIVTIKHASGGRHVTLANRAFNRRKDSTFEGLGGNQGNQVKVSTFPCAHIVACRKWIPKPGSVFNPKSSSPTESESDGSKESTR